MAADIFIDSFREFRTKEINLKRVKWKAFLAFEVYGVRIGIKSNNHNLIENLENNLPNLFPVKLEKIDYKESEHLFSFYISNRNKSKNAAYREDSELISRLFTADDFDIIESKIRLTVAKFSQADVPRLYKRAV